MKLNKIFTISLAGLSFLLPLFFLPFTADFYFLNKTSLLYLVIAGLLIVWAVNALLEKSFSWQKNSFTLPILSLTAVFLIATFNRSPNKADALAGPTGLVLGLGLLYFLIVNNIEKKAVKWILAGFVGSSAVLAWLTIFSYLKILGNIAPNLTWLQNRAWTPTGSVLNTLSLMIILLPGTLYWAFKTNKAIEKILLFLALSLQILSVVLIVSLFAVKEIQFIFLPPYFGWQICADGLKNLRTALLGAGPANFLPAFTNFRPIGLNNTNLWTAQFTANSNQYFHLLSTVGLLGLLSYLWLALRALRTKEKVITGFEKLVYIFLASSFLIQLFIPASLLILYLTFVLLALTAILRKKEVDLSFKTADWQVKREALVWAAGGVAGLLALVILYFQVRLWRADYYFRQSLVAAQENRGVDTYNLQIKALQLNPKNANYRLAYASTNFALANSLASQPDLTDQDRTNVTQLISQSIREAKTVINLNPQVAGYWANLASLYRNIIGVAQDADQWAIAAYLEAVRNDPTNPLLRIDFGGLFFALGDYERAVEQFKIAANLKPDYANAYYNLSAVYEVQEQWQKAFSNKQLALNFAPVESPDRQRVMDELVELRKKLPAAPQQPAIPGQVREEERLQPPQAIPSPQPGFEEIKLPEETGPEVPEVSPSPSPKAEASPEGSVNP